MVTYQATIKTGNSVEGRGKTFCEFSELRVCFGFPALAASLFESCIALPCLPSPLAACSVTPGIVPR